MKSFEIPRAFVLGTGLPASQAGWVCAAKTAAARQIGNLALLTTCADADAWSKDRLWVSRPANRWSL